MSDDARPLLRQYLDQQTARLALAESICRKIATDDEASLYPDGLLVIDAGMRLDEAETDYLWSLEP